MRAVLKIATLESSGWTRNKLGKFYCWHAGMTHFSLQLWWNLPTKCQKSGRAFSLTLLPLHDHVTANPIKKDFLKSLMACGCPRICGGLWIIESNKGWNFWKQWQCNMHGCNWPKFGFSPHHFSAKFHALQFCHDPSSFCIFLLPKDCSLLKIHSFAPFLDST